MIKSIFKSGWNKLKTLHKDDKGAVLMITLAVFLFLYMVCSATYAVGTVIHEKIQLQNACDAAAYSAAIVEADGLSRIATINRAMSWTYVQTTRMHMDYIVHSWLRLTAERFIQDRSNCRSFNQNRCWDVVQQGNTRWIPWPFCSHSSGTGSGRSFCGWTPALNDVIRLGYSTSSEAGSRSGFQFGGLVSLGEIQAYTSDRNRSFLSNLQLGIQNGKLTIQMLNVMLAAVVSTLNDEMYSAAESALKDNLPKDYNGDEYRVKILLPIFLDPYQDYSSTNSNDDSESENSNDDSESDYVKSVVSAYKNTEEDELEFLSASMKTDSLQNIFGNGIDQWFIRGTKSILKPDFNRDFEEASSNNFNVRSLNHPANITNWSISGIDHYAARGFQRGYKTANRNEVAQVTVQRGNHISYSQSLLAGGGLRFPNTRAFLSTPRNAISQLSASLISAQVISSPIRDNIPSCFNHKHLFTEQCNSIVDNFGLVSEYHYSAWRWWCVMRQVWIPWPVNNWITVAIEHYKHYPIDGCGSHGNGGRGSFSRANYRSCFIGADDISLQTDTHGSSNGVWGYMTMGFARIYGDDAEIYNDRTKDMYITEQVRPVKLNHRFFQDRIQVIVAKKQTNPFRWMLGTEAQQNISYAREVDKKSVFTMFDPPEFGYFPKTWSVAISTATAAFRNADRRYTSREIYETKYRQTSSYEYDENIDEEPYIKLKANGNELNSDSEFAKYRVGCPHVSENNIAARLRRTWNLCETDWNAVFLPTRYTHTGFHTSYDGYSSDPNRRYGYESALAYRRYSVENNSGEGSSILNHIAQNLLSKMSYMKTNNDDSTSTMELDIYKVEGGKLVKSGRESLRIGFGFIWAHPGTTDTCRIEDMTTYKIQ